MESAKQPPKKKRQHDVLAQTTNLRPLASGSLIRSAEGTVAYPHFLPVPAVMCLWSLLIRRHLSPTSAVLTAETL